MELSKKDIRQQRNGVLSPISLASCNDLQKVVLYLDFVVQIHIAEIVQKHKIKLKNKKFLQINVSQNREIYQRYQEKILQICDDISKPRSFCRTSR